MPQMCQFAKYSFRIKVHEVKEYRRMQVAFKSEFSGKNLRTVYLNVLISLLDLLIKIKELKHVPGIWSYRPIWLIPHIQWYTSMQHWSNTFQVISSLSFGTNVGTNTRSKSFEVFKWAGSKHFRRRKFLGVPVACKFALPGNTDWPKSHQSSK